MINQVAIETLGAAVMADLSLSFRAKGIFLYLLMRPNNSGALFADLVKVSSDGDHSVSRGLGELRSRGYVLAARMRGRDGRMLGWNHIVNPEKLASGHDNQD